MTISDFELGRILFLFSRHTVTQINQAQPNKQKEQKEQISYFKAQNFSNFIKNPKDNRFSKKAVWWWCQGIESRLDELK